MKSKLPPLLLARNHAVISVPSPDGGEVVLMLLKITIGRPSEPATEKELEISLQPSTARELAQELLKQATHAEQLQEGLDKPKH